MHACVYTLFHTIHIALVLRPHPVFLQEQELGDGDNVKLLHHEMHVDVVEHVLEHFDVSTVTFAAIGSCKCLQAALNRQCKAVGFARNEYHKKWSFITVNNMSQRLPYRVSSGNILEFSSASSILEFHVISPSLLSVGVCFQGLLMVYGHHGRVDL